jgi:hypothetical protein
MIPRLLRSFHALVSAAVLLVSAALLLVPAALLTVPSARAESTWTERDVPGPSPRGEFGFAFDSDEGVAVLFGGASSLNFSAVNGETWTWDSDAWTLADSTGLPDRCDNAMAYDSVRNRVVSFGGYDGLYWGDTWVRQGGIWSQVTGAMPPSPRADSFMAFDSQRAVMVLFGGQVTNGTIRSDTWEFADSTWTQRAPSGPPPARWIHRMAYDAAREVTVMFGGAAPGIVRGDTWEWDGSSWTPNLGSGPPARYGHAMAFDSGNGVTVLFGGQTGIPFGQGVLGDTWTYDGSTWTQLPIAGPSPRSFVKMVYDSVRGRIVLFGGWNGTQMVDDTWELEIGSSTGSSTSALGEWMRVQSVPNPFRGRTEIRYSVSSTEHVTITIYDAAGALVHRLLDRTERAGTYSIPWNGTDGSGARVAAGTYFYRVETGSGSASGRMVLVR